MKGHFQKICRSKPSSSRTTSLVNPGISSIFNISSSIGLSKSIVDIIVNNIPLHVLIDTGSCESYISSDIALKHAWTITSFESAFSIASTNLSCVISGDLYATVLYKSMRYGAKLSLLSKLCSDVILGLDFLSQYQSVVITFIGKRPQFAVCTLKARKSMLPLCSTISSPGCTPSSTKSRRFSCADTVFIGTEIRKLLAGKITEPSYSPWLA
ncbi:hypothetical protein CLF_103024 [Clonorchis sinensis]|uniref:Uncharacterized protein n=1 Tax=Clonorchis sinensis TaxID=79923 RepID=G7Y8X3_CLOSI|nr:hypothetical protein CLF_103024 [Clonorchis sinensis]